MPAFDDSAVSPAAPQDVWLMLYDPLRFPLWWTGIETALAGDAKGGTADVTIYPDGYPDFPMLTDSSAAAPRIVDSRCPAPSPTCCWIGARAGAGGDADQRARRDTRCRGRPARGTARGDIDLAAQAGDLAAPPQP